MQPKTVRLGIDLALLLMLLNNKSVSLGQDRVLVVEEWEGP